MAATVRRQSDVTIDPKVLNWDDWLTLYNHAYAASRLEREAWAVLERIIGSPFEVAPVPSYSTDFWSYQIPQVRVITLTDFWNSGRNRTLVMVNFEEQGEYLPLVPQGHTVVRQPDCPRIAALKAYTPS